MVIKNLWVNVAILECIRCIRNVLEVITKGYLLKYFYSDATSKTQNMSISPADLPHFRHFRLQKKIYSHTYSFAASTNLLFFPLKTSKPLCSGGCLLAQLKKACQVIKDKVIQTWWWFSAPPLLLGIVNWMYFHFEWLLIVVFTASETFDGLKPLPDGFKDILKVFEYLQLQ